MSATFVNGYSFGATELVTNAKLHLLVTAMTVSGITGAELSASAAIADTQLAQITTASKVSVSSLTSGVFWESNLVSYEDDFVYST